MAVGYEPDGSVAPLYDLGWEAPAGQMYSTTNDLTKVYMCMCVHACISQELRLPLSRPAI